jgi:hypothetical protein
MFFGFHDLREVEQCSCTFNPKSPRTFGGVVELVSRYVDRMSRYGMLSVTYIEDDTSSDGEGGPMQVSPPAGPSDYMARDASHIGEPVVPLNQLCFCYGDDSSLTVPSMGHFVSVQRVDVSDTRIVYPKNTRDEHKSRFWWLQNSTEKLQLFHEDYLPDYFFRRKQQVFVIPLRLPVRVADRTTIVADQFDCAINSLLAVAGLASLGPISRQPAG